MNDAFGPIDDAMLAHLRAVAKREIRTRMRAVRRVIPLEACAARSAKANARLLELPEYEQARCVVGYHAMRKELDPAPLLAAAAAAGKQTGLPRVDDERLAIHAYAPGDELEESGYGMLEPLATAPLIAAEAIDLIVIPALALDASGQRLGYGRAF